jgi:hypothetical protein
MPLQTNDVFGTVLFDLANLSPFIIALALGIQSVQLFFIFTKQDCRFRCR